MQPTKSQGHAGVNRATNVHHVAELAGVSPVTVARAFSGTAPVAESTRRNIMAAAKELGYRPNLLARGLRGGQTQTIGILWSMSTSRFGVDVPRVITMKAQDRGYMTNIADFIADDIATKEVLLDFKHRCIDALVMQWSSPAPADPEIKNLIREFRASVLVTPAFEDLGVDQIVQDRFAAIREVADHFVKTGRKKPGLVMPGESNLLKIEAFVSQLGQYGINCECVMRAEFKYRSDSEMAGQTYDALSQMAADCGDLPDALLCANDECAIAAISWAFDHGLKVPEDLAVVGINDSGVARFIRPPLASIARRDEELARMIDRLIFERLEQPDLPIQKEMISMKFVCRESAG